MKQVKFKCPVCDAATFLEQSKVQRMALMADETIRGLSIPCPSCNGPIPLELVQQIHIFLYKRTLSYQDIIRIGWRKILRRTNASLRSMPVRISEDNAVVMLHKQGFFDYYNNDKAAGIKHEFESNNKIIYDHVTGLWWQKAGSTDETNYDGGLQYIDNLNQERFAGFKDWRMPTLEEAMSLVEPRKSKAELHINVVFNKKQDKIWTADATDVYGAQFWYVNFLDGNCEHTDEYSCRYVRATSFGKRK